MANSSTVYCPLRNNVRMVSCILASTFATRLDPNILSDGRQSPLGAAAYQGSHELVALLLKADGIQIDTANEDEDDTLWLAIQNRSTSVIELFLRESLLNVTVQYMYCTSTHEPRPIELTQFNLPSLLFMRIQASLPAQVCPLSDWNDLRLC